MLALDVYFREPRARQSKRDPAVADLSRVLRALPLPIERPDPERFRNVNGVFMKLQNFKAVDPDYTADGRSGLGAGATQRERTLYERYADNQAELRALAQQIRDRVDEGGEALPGTPEEGEEGSVEGRVLYRVHRTRERKKSEEKKRAVLEATGRLECEACGFDFQDHLRGERPRLRRVPSQASSFRRHAHDLPARLGDRLRELPSHAPPGRSDQRGGTSRSDEARLSPSIASSGGIFLGQQMGQHVPQTPADLSRSRSRESRLKPCST